MKTFVLSIISILLFTSFIYPQAIQWQQLNGPFGGTAFSVASNSNGDLFAGADQNQRGVFKSTDDGLTWLPKSSGIALADRAINWISIDDSGYVIAGTGSHIGNGVYKSKDGGDSWVKIADLGGTSVAKNDSGHIYVGNTAYAQYSVSKDAGYTWTHYSHASPFINSITINDSGHIFIGGNYTGYRSKDYGANWTTLSLPDGINSIAVAPNGNLFAGCSREYAANSGVYRSTDNGDSWAVVKDGFRVYASNNIVINNSGDIIVGTWGWGIWKSTDNGDTWSQHNSGLAHFYIRSVHITNNGVVYAGLSGGGIYRSTDNGESWTQVGITAASVKKIAISPVNGNLFASGNGVSRSSDNGQTWIPINNGLTGPDVRSFAIKEDGTIFAGSGISNWAYPNPCIFRSTDNGNSWVEIENGIQRHDVEGITVDAEGNVYAGNYYGVYKSTNDGDNWANIGGAGGAKELCFNSLGDLFLASWGGGFWKLPAGDTTWVNLTTIINSSWNWSMLIASNDYIYVGSKRSTDNGITWEEITYPGPYICYAENSVGNIFIGTRSYGNGIWRSTDFGESWEAINTGLSTLEIWSLAVDSEDFLYAGTDGKSMFKTTTSTVTSVENEKSLPSTFYLEQNYPNPFNPSTRISWQSPVGGWQTLKVYDVLGNEIATLVDEYKPAGRYEVEFNVAQSATSDRPAIASGVYFYQLKVSDPEINSRQGFIKTNKMIIMK